MTKYGIRLFWRNWNLRVAHPNVSPGLRALYLINLLPTVDIDGHNSTSHFVNIGVSQSSGLSPTLFLLHANHLLPSTFNHTHSYAGHCIQYTSQIIQLDLSGPIFILFFSETFFQNSQLHNTSSSTVHETLSILFRSTFNFP